MSTHQPAWLDDPNHFTSGMEIDKVVFVKEKLDKAIKLRWWKAKITAIVDFDTTGNIVYTRKSSHDKNYIVVWNKKTNILKYMTKIEAKEIMKLLEKVEYTESLCLHDQFWGIANQHQRLFV
tara:strand:- start:648 stop:1013 length:366 start_codon:yes stop_codon:yes gene_type:complete